MNKIQDIRIEDYTYCLPEERIAKYPLEERDASKLLVYTESDCSALREPRERRFVDIASYLPADSLMVFNNTKVVPARLLFRKETGAIIEVFCLEPCFPEDYQMNFATTGRCRWKAIIGNAKRWKSGTLSLYAGEGNPEADLLSEMDMKAELVSRDPECVVEFTWSGGFSFSKVMEHCGRIPIPPYLKRETEAIDLERYQTYYAKNEGSVAAPTAGLHFTQKELDDIDSKGIVRANLCLHVGAGTFLPVKSETIGDHTMHSEPFSVSRDFLLKLRSFAGKPVTAVGTTSTRCLESLYFLGVHCIEKGEPGLVEQWEPYREEGYSYSLAESIDALIGYLDRNGSARLYSRTRIIIVPGYRFRVISYLVTNFHQPQSTLLLLISALVGDSWRRVYDFALKNGFRFLSYGDSSLLQKTE
ncbi:MAG: S-adenosylmethionine:tRNA ribosyltransferase-isomerase [Bacteroidales bacterium]|nr:S-adenosylmethionine:tRNA ribosyltransferase-isomerase [Candidatus Cacconaster merdequi]